MHKNKSHMFSGFGLVALVAILAAISAAVVGGYSVYTKVSDKGPSEPAALEEFSSQNSIESNSLATAELDLAELIDNDAVQTDPLLLATPAEEEMAENVASAVKLAEPVSIQTITLAGGCFWCSEAFLQETPGVLDAVSGYAGGSADTADYKAVSTGKTGHREAVQVTYDSRVVTTEEILDVYWAHINPTDAGGQFADRGTHYTTAIYFHSEFQKQTAQQSKSKLEASGLFEQPIVTLILPYTSFYVAEEYHQDYYKKASDHYERYKKASGRSGFIDDNWAKEAALQFLSE